MIIVDMFEVQLGASILLRFVLDDKSTVSVLADAGVRAKGYKPEHVRDKLLKIFPDENDRLIDLIIGTHYDADHLRGLPPIIEDKSFHIGEIWLPPVQNDEQAACDEPLSFEQRILGKQFEEQTDAILCYLKAKKDRIRDLTDIVIHAGQIAELSEDIAPFKKIAAAEDSYAHLPSADDYESYFRTILGIQEESDFVDSDFEVNGFYPFSLTENIDYLPRYYAWERVASKLLGDHWSYCKISVKRDILALADICKAQAKSAITAIHLNRIVQAINSRNEEQRIPCCYKFIPQGHPTTYSWDSTLQRFLVDKNRNENSLTLDILGPSDTLIEKHREILPVGNYAAYVALSPISKMRITPANELSYVVRFTYHAQGILIVGDAGFVDFRSNTGKLFDGLKEKLQPLHVVQVAHHAGYNDDFYNVLLDAGYGQQEERSFLLLSHAVSDKTRPSLQFDKFIAQVHQYEDDIALLFTSQPDLSKVLNYVPLIFPVVGNQATHGDIRIEYGYSWSVTQHAIKV